MHGIAAAHLKQASPVILQILTHLTNEVFTHGILPSSFKVGKVTPVLKKGKPAKSPNSYRRITVTSIVGKIVEKK